MAVDNLEGKKFGLLTVGTLSHKDKYGQLHWNVVCDCGTKKTVAASNLRRKTRSCGCVKNRKTSERMKTHGMSKSAIYRIWKGIHSRCYIKTATGYENYGGRGIKVADEWHTFEQFYKDMGDRPSPRHSIDRIDVNGWYGPKNCKWATRKEQGLNKRTNTLITADGETMCVTEWAQRINVSESAIRSRIKRGWDLKSAALAPPNRHKQLSAKRITANGKTQTVKNWASELGVSPSTIDSRIKNGWAPERAVTTPKIVR